MTKNESQENVTTYELETYCMFKNVDESILKLNQIVQKDGYEFVGFTALELEQKFSSLFSLEKGYKVTRGIRLENGDVISNTFYTALTNHPLGKANIDLLNGGNVYFLKSLDNSFQRVVNNVIQIGDTDGAFEGIRKYSSELVRKFRLFKDGGVTTLGHFHIQKDSRHIGRRVENGLYSIYASRKKFSIADLELPNLKTHLSKEINSTPLTELAENYFESSYKAVDFRMKFINLVTALESLFNRGKDQISHIIARHLALIVSKDREEFQSNYKRVKKIYGMRSLIVHGQALKSKEKQIIGSLDELQNLTRQAILYCLESKKTKEELFAYLNAKGFED